MSVSGWIKDLQSLAAARRSSGKPWHEDFQELRAAAYAVQSSDSETRRRAAFCSVCENFTSSAHNMPEEMPDTGLFGDLFQGKRILDVVDPLMHYAREITARLEPAEPAERIVILAEYGIHTAAKIDQGRVAAMARAIDGFGGPPGGLGPTSTWEECRWFATDAASALGCFLNACR